MKSFASSCLIAAASLVIGCDSRDEKPRGAGASGKSLAVLSTPQIDMERFFTYTEEQEKVIALMNRPFAESIKKTGAVNDKSAAELLDKVGAGWDALPFIRKKEGVKVRFRLKFDTSAGELVMDFFEGFTPDVVRNFIARAKSNGFDGLPIAMENDMLVFGAPPEKNGYTIQARPIPTPMPKGTVFATLIGDRSAGDRFGISLKRIPDGGSKVSMFGRLVNPSIDTLLNELVEKLKKKPGSVVINSVKAQTFESQVFQGADVVLPRLTKNGELELVDLPMYTGVPSTAIYGSDHKGHSHEKDDVLDPDLGGTAIQSKNPNIPTKSPQQGKPNPP